MAVSKSADGLIWWEGEAIAGPEGNLNKIKELACAAGDAVGWRGAEGCGKMRIGRDPRSCL